MSIRLRWLRRPEASLPVLVLASALGTRADSVFGRLMPSLEHQTNVLALDLPGHTGAPHPDGLTVEQLANDVTTDLNHMGVREYHFAGLSIGSAIGIALSRDGVGPRGLVLMGAAARFGDAQAWADRRDHVLKSGTSWLPAMLQPRWFRERPGDVHAGWVDKALGDVRGCDTTGYAALCDALALYDARSYLANVSTPTWVIAALEDEVAPVEAALDLCRSLPNLVSGILVPRAGHVLPIEAPGIVAATLLQAIRGDD